MNTIKQYTPIVRIEIRTMWNEKEFIDCPINITKDMLDKALADSSRFINLWDETINKADIRRVFKATPSNDMEEFIAQQKGEYKNQLSAILKERNEKQLKTNW